MMQTKTYEINSNSQDETAISIISMLINQLEGMRDTTPHPEELEWELRLYRFILESPRMRLDAYQDARWDKNRRLLSKRKAVANLGWVIP